MYKVGTGVVAGFMGGVYYRQRTLNEQREFNKLKDRVNTFVWREHYKIHDAIVKHKEGVDVDLNTYMRTSSKKNHWDSLELDKLTNELQNFKFTVFSPTSIIGAPIFYYLFRHELSRNVYERTYSFPFYYRDEICSQTDALRALESTAKMTNFVNKEIIGKEKVYNGIDEDIHETKKCDFRSPVTDIPFRKDMSYSRPL
jgi:hypothetical protein